MALKWTTLSLITLLELVWGDDYSQLVDDMHESHHILTDTWIVEIEGGIEIAQLIAEEHQYEYLGKVSDTK